jgi:hypothetical protein
MKNLKAATVKKEWKMPEFYLIDSVEAKHIAANEGTFTKSVPIGGGSFKLYAGGGTTFTTNHKISSVNS